MIVLCPECWALLDCEVSPPVVPEHHRPGTGKTCEGSNKPPKR